jgi:hypothetical protein
MRNNSFKDEENKSGQRAEARGGIKGAKQQDNISLANLNEKS